MDRYYYDQRRIPSRKGGGRGLFPFLLLIILGVVVVLGFRLFTAFYGTGDDDGVFMYVVNGQAQLKLWGTEDFSKAYSGMKVLQGDELYVAKDSQVVVEFFDDVLVRVDGGTQVVFNEIYSDSGGVEIQLVLKNGAIWVNRTALEADGTEFLVLTDNVLVQPEVDAVFDVENIGGEEIVRVVYGSAVLDVYSRNGGTVVDHVIVEAGTEAVFDNDKLERFWKFQAPNISSDLSEEFKESSWYLWNLQEDEDPSEFVVEQTQQVQKGEADFVPSEQAQEAEGDPVPTASDSELSTNKKAGPATSDPPEVGSLKEEVSQEEQVAVESVVLDLGPLGALSIVEVNGEIWDGSMFEEGVTVIGEPIKVVGKVSGAEKVVVNGYQLQRFEPKQGEEDFVYWLKGEYSNLLEGENTYEVYALSPDGLRSESVYFKVIFEPEEEVVLEDDPEVELE